MSRWIRLLSLAVLFVLLAGCGGDESGAPADPGTSTPADSERPDAPASSEPLGNASISGIISFAGDVPKMRTIKMDADPGCAAKHSGPVVGEALVLGTDQTMANVIVRITEGLPARNWAPPAEPVLLDQDGCRYSPHVVGLVKGQELKILNSDGLLHNVHALPKDNKEFNMAMPATRKEAARSFTIAEAPFKIKCDVHPWMGAFIFVSENPYFSITGEDGKFTIDGLPAGSYTLEAWHEVLETQTMEITVGEGENSQVAFTFSRG